jgi:hypothetical protein
MRLHSWHRVWRITGSLLQKSSRTWRLAAKWGWTDYYDLFKKAYTELRKTSFARWNSFDECCLEMTGLGHPATAADEICKSIMTRAEEGTLYKAVETMEVIKADNDIILYGPASWELLDREGDFITTEAQRHFLRKLFNQVPERYRNIMDEHKNFQAGEPLLTFKTSDGRSLYSHVHEKGLMLITKVRPEDGLEKTRALRESVLNGSYKSYSIAGRPIRFEKKLEKGQEITYHYDIDPDEISLCRVGVNPQARFEVVQKGITTNTNTANIVEGAIMTGGSDAEKPSLDAQKSYSAIRFFNKLDDLQKPFANYTDFDDCVAQNQDKGDPKAYCASIKENVEGKAISTLDLTWLGSLIDEPPAKSNKAATIEEIKDILKRELKR